MANTGIGLFFPVTCQVDILLTTNLAARGIDIEGVETVINMDFPRSITEYIHRVGRTARAGRSGRAVTLVTEPEKTMLKQLIARTELQAKKRALPSEAIDAMTAKWEELQGQVHEMLEQEKVDKELRVAEMEANKASNMMEHEREIMARPARTWFTSKREKEEDRRAEPDVEERRDLGFFGDLVEADDGGKDKPTIKRDVGDVMPEDERPEWQNKKARKDKAREEARAKKQEEKENPRHIDRRKAKREQDKEEMSRVVGKKVRDPMRLARALGRKGKKVDRQIKEAGFRPAVIKRKMRKEEKAGAGARGRTKPGRR